MTVSVVLTCHNEAAFIEHALRSVDAQTARDRVVEIVVVDDGSTDESPALLARLRREIDNLRVLRTEGIGVSAARNAGIRATRRAAAGVSRRRRLLGAGQAGTPAGFELEDGRVGLVYSDFVDFAQPDASDAQLVRVRRFHADDAQTLERYFVHDGPIVPSAILVAARRLRRRRPVRRDDKPRRGYRVFLRSPNAGVSARPGGVGL